MTLPSWYCEHPLLPALLYQKPCTMSLGLPHKPQERFWGLNQLYARLHLILPKTMRRNWEGLRGISRSCSAACLQIPRVQKLQESKLIRDSGNKAAGEASVFPCLLGSEAEATIMSESPGGCKDPWRCILIIDSGLSYLHVSLLMLSPRHKLFRTASKVSFTVVCKETLSLTVFRVPSTPGVAYGEHSTFKGRSCQ